MSIDLEALGQHESIHVPAPGSARDMVAQAAQHETSTAPAPEPAPRKIKSIDTKTAMPEESIPRTMQLSQSNPFLQVLPRDMQRRRAIIIPISNDVALAESRQSASLAYQTYLNGNSVSTFNMSAYIPAKTTVVIEHRDEVWAVVSTTASTSPVTVIVERYAEGV
jgi:hypothetical protein